MVGPEDAAGMSVIVLLIVAGGAVAAAFLAAFVWAVRAGQFHIWAVGTIDEGLEILTGMPAGERDFEGQYPEGSINGRVDRRLREFIDDLREPLEAEPGASLLT